MSYIYKKKVRVTGGFEWDQLLKAVKAIQDGALSVNTVYRYSNIPEPPLSK